MYDEADRGVFDLVSEKWIELFKQLLGFSKSGLWFLAV